MFSTLCHSPTSCPLFPSHLFPVSRPSVALRYTTTVFSLFWHTFISVFALLSFALLHLALPTVNLLTAASLPATLLPVDLVTSTHLPFCLRPVSLLSVSLISVIMIPVFLRPVYVLPVALINVTLFALASHPLASPQVPSCSITFSLVLSFLPGLRFVLRLLIRSSPPCLLYTQSPLSRCLL